MSSKFNIKNIFGKSTPKVTSTAKTAATPKTNVAATPKTNVVATPKTNVIATPKTNVVAIPKVLPPIPTLETKKIKGQKDIDVKNITGDTGKKIFKKVKKESNVDTGPDSIDSILKNTETIVEKVSDLVLKLIKFIKKSLMISELKKVFFMIFMAIAMAILFMGLNILFGKVIL